MDDQRIDVGNKYHNVCKLEAEKEPLAVGIECHSGISVIREGYNSITMREKTRSK